MSILNDDTTVATSGGLARNGSGYLVSCCAYDYDGSLVNTPSSCVDCRFLEFRALSISRTIELLSLVSPSLSSLFFVHVRERTAEVS